LNDAEPATPGEKNFTASLVSVFEVTSATTPGAGNAATKDIVELLFKENTTEPALPTSTRVGVCTAAIDLLTIGALIFGNGTRVVVVVTFGGAVGAEVVAGTVVGAAVATGAGFVVVTGTA
jgi:hypothetical protein